MRTKEPYHTVNGHTGTIKELSERFGLAYQTVYARIRKGYTVEQALTEPLGASKHKKRRHRTFIDHTGEKHGKLTVRERAGAGRSGHVMWLCDCECGRTRIISSSSLRYVTSCGQCNGKTPPRRSDAPNFSTQPCWSCQNYAGGCSWTRKEAQPVEGWKAEKSIRYRGYRENPVESWQIIWCPEYISDGTEDCHE